MRLINADRINFYKANLRRGVLEFDAAAEDCSDYYAAHNVTAQDFCPYRGAKTDGGETDEAK